jgi:tetratricopeptide (TPR) repeat protein
MIAKGHHREVYRILQRLDRVKRFSHIPEIAFLKGECLNVQGAWDNAIDEYNNSLLFGEEEEDLSLVSTSLRKIAEIQMWRGSPESVMESLQRSAEISEEIKDLKGLASSYYDIAALLRTESEYKESEAYANKCLETARTSGDIAEIARAYNAIGAAKGYTGSKKESIRVREKAIDTARKSDDLALLSACLSNLAGEYYEDEQMDKALELRQESLEAARGSGNARSIAWSLSDLASVHISKEEYQIANQHLDEAADIYQRLQEHRLLAQMYIQYGYIFEDEDWGKAKKYLNKGLELISNFGSPADICEYHINVGHLYRWRGDKEGMAYIEEAKILLERIEDPVLRKKLESKIHDALTDTPKGA